MYKIQSKWDHQDTIKIEWNLGKRCNLDCGYCPDTIHDNYSQHTDIAILKNTVDILKKLDKPVRLSLTGGEPSVHPKIEELIKYIKDSGIKWLSMTTNATRQPDWYLKNEEYLDQYVFSLHFEKDWERLLNTILVVNERKIKKIFVHIMAHHTYMKQVKDAVHKLSICDVPYVIRRIRWSEGDRDLFDDMRYHLDDLNWIKENTATAEPNCVIDDIELMHANDIIKLKINAFNGWSCNVGIESLMINWDGEIHRATCRVGGSLGNIYNGDFTIPDTSIICTRNWCTCEADISITKQRA